MKNKTIKLVLLGLMINSMALAEAKAYNKKNVPGYASDHGETVWELAGNSLGNTQKHSVALVDFAPGKASRLHMHPEIEETYYVLNGEGLVTLNGLSTVIKKGDLIAIPPQTSHIVVNTSPEQVLELLVTAAKPWTPDCMEYLD